eukprot:Opistho-2@28467
MATTRSTRSGRNAPAEEADAGGASSSAVRATEFFAAKQGKVESALLNRGASAGPHSDETKWKELVERSEELKTILRMHWEAKLEANANKLKEGSAEYESLFKENDKIATVRKERVFQEEVTEGDLSIIQQRVELQQKQYEEYKKKEERRKYAKISVVYDYLTDEEIRYMLTECEEEEDSVLSRLADPRAGFLSMIRKRIAQDHMQTYTQHLTKEQQDEYDLLVAKRKSTAKKATSAEAKEKTRKYMSVKRLRLNDAMKAINDGTVSLEEAMKDWSGARIRAYRLIKENPNAYYYRFNDPGEMQRNGGWSKEEHDLFLARLAEIGADGQWGLFAMKIPGRVGYQCSNYYRTLIQNGKIKDENYVLDDKGKAHYLFSTKKPGGSKEIRTFSRKGNGSDEDDGGEPKKRRSSSGSKPKSKKRRRGSDDDDSQDDNLDENGSWKPTQSFYTTKRCRKLKGELVDEDLENAVNPLPGRTDPITLEEVVVPTISPSGHVMSYSSWLQCLAQGGVCPVTKQPVNKKDLVILTMDNIDQYRDKIREG